MKGHSVDHMTESTITPDQESIQELHLKRITALENENKHLSEEIETLRMEKEDTRAKLVETLISNKKYMREEERLKKENALLRRMPLFLATVVEMGEDYVLLRYESRDKQLPDDRESDGQVRGREGKDDGADRGPHHILRSGGRT
jgi:proteasome regulatory subunit